jgi:hypothetical protein
MSSAKKNQVELAKTGIPQRPGQIKVRQRADIYLLY